MKKGLRKGMNIRPRDGSLGRRALSMRLDAGGRPASLDEETRSFEVVAATETPVSIWDWEIGGRVDEILLMSGCRVPTQTPLLDTHSRWSVGDIAGSARNWRVEGEQLLARAFCSSLDKGENTLTLAREGHLTDVSAGYRVHAYMRVKAGETTTYNGKTYTGPALLATDWEPAELSVCPIGADRNAKTRSEGPQTEEDEMPITEKMRAKLVALGMRADATDEEARQFLGLMGVRADGEEAPALAALDKLINQRAEAAPPVSAPATGQCAEPGSNVGEEVRAALAAERTRAGEIRAMCRSFGCADDMAERLVNEGQSVDQARAAVLANLQARQAGSQSAGFRVEVGVTEPEKFRAAAQDGLLLRGGMPVAAPAPGADNFRGMTLREVAREALYRAGQSVPSDPMEMIGRALTTSDLPAILGGSANRVLVEAYGAAAETYGVWTDDTGSLPDFKPQTLVRISEFGELDEIPESGEYEAGRMSEAIEAVKLTTFGKVFVISRQAIINDDLGAIVDAPRQMGEAAARKIGDLPYAVLVANAKMGDGKALFHADHLNLAAAGASVDVASLNKAFAAMALQKDMAGERRLNLRPSFFLGPVSIMGEVETFFQTDKIRGADGAEFRNIYSGQVLTRAYDARLDDDSTKAWYVVGPKGKTVKLYFLNGNKVPFMETRQGWSRDGVEFKIRLDAAAKALDWKTFYKNPGA